MNEPKPKRTFESPAMPVLTLAPQPQKAEENNPQPALKPGLKELSSQEQSQLVDRLINRLKKI